MRVWSAPASVTMPASAFCISLVPNPVFLVWLRNYLED